MQTSSQSSKLPYLKLSPPESIAMNHPVEAMKALWPQLTEDGVYSIMLSNGGGYNVLALRTAGGTHGAILILGYIFQNTITFIQISAGVWTEYKITGTVVN